MSEIYTTGLPQETCDKNILDIICTEIAKKLNLPTVEVWQPCIRVDGHVPEGYYAIKLPSGERITVKIACVDGDPQIHLPLRLNK